MLRAAAVTLYCEHRELDNGFRKMLNDALAVSRFSAFQTVHALALALKGAHFPALFRQIAGDEAAHGMSLPSGLIADLVQAGRRLRHHAFRAQ